MNAPPIPAGPSFAGQLHARRCARYPAREAAARCPGCGEFFCRECVVEHGGKLLCATCVARAAIGVARRQRRLATLRRAGSTVGAIVVLWILFYWTGAILVKIPPEFHDGTVWKKMVDRP